MSETVENRIIETDKLLTAIFAEHPIGLVPDTYVSRASGVRITQILWYRRRHSMPSYRPTRCAGKPHSPLMHLGRLLTERGETWTREWANRALDRSISASVEQAIVDRAEVGILSKPTRGNKPEWNAYQRGNKTYNAKGLTREERQAARELDLEDIEIDRPKTRADCINGLRPCPYASCKFNLFSDVSSVGSLIINQKNMEDPSELKHSCALDIADQGGKTLEEVGEAMGLTRERIRQIEVMSLEKLRDAGFDLQDLYHT